MLSCIVICRNTDKKPYDNTTDGGGATKLAAAFGIPLSKAKALIKIYFLQFHKLPVFFKKRGQEAMQEGYILTNNFIKRRSYIQEFERYTQLRNLITRYEINGWRPVPAWYRELEMIESSIQRRAQNYTIQGTAADMSKLAGIFLRRQAIKTGLFDVLLLIHDEYMVECYERNAQKVANIVEECMLLASKYFLTRLSIPAEAKITKSWSK